MSSLKCVIYGSLSEAQESRLENPINFCILQIYCYIFCLWCIFLVKKKPHNLIEFLDSPYITPTGIEANENLQIHASCLEGYLTGHSSNWILSAMWPEVAWKTICNVCTNSDISHLGNSGYLHCSWWYKVFLMSQTFN